MEEVKEINEKIKEYRNSKRMWKNKEIKININSTEESFTVNGFGVCENNNFEENGFRYYLEFDINNSLPKKRTIVSIMMNPSDKTNPTGDGNPIDSTVTNVIKMAYVSGYSKVIILNSFPYINGNGEESLKEKDNSEDKNKLNKDFIYEFLKENVNNVDILLAWGGQIKNTKEDFAEALENYNDKIYVYDVTADKFPMHPSPYNNENVQKAINDGENCFKKVNLLIGNGRKKIGVAIKKDIK